jgi:hypothetical protein
MRPAIIPHHLRHELRPRRLPGYAAVRDHPPTEVNGKSSASKSTSTTETPSGNLVRSFQVLWRRRLGASNRTTSPGRKGRFKNACLTGKSPAESSTTRLEVPWLVVPKKKYSSVAEALEWELEMRCGEGREGREEDDDKNGADGRRHLPLRAGTARWDLEKAWSPYSGITRRR